MSPSIDLGAAVLRLEHDGFFLGLEIKPSVLGDSVPYWVDKGPGVYVDAHLHCAPIGQIASDPQVLNVVRAYFRCEPKLVECKLFVTDGDTTDPLAAGYHFDHAGPRSLNVMAYLTPVNEDNGPHVLVAGTQRHKRLRDYLRELTPIHIVDRRYPGRVHTITGPAGTVLIENAEIFHRRLQAKRRRVAIIAVYSTSRRRILSVGRDPR